MIYSETNTPHLPSARIVEAVQARLGQHKKVLWLLSGGSVIAVAVEAARQLENQPLLTVMQIDERYGPVGHADSNWQQLLESGFNEEAFSCHPILQGKDFEQTTSDYEVLLRQALKQADFVIGLFGIGTDGHTAGILPGSAAATEQRQLVVAYEGPDFKRMTVTPPLFAEIDLAVVYALGEAKIPALMSLRRNLSVVDQPAQALKKAKELDVYTDNKGVI